MNNLEITFAPEPAPAPAPAPAPTKDPSIAPSTPKVDPDKGNDPWKVPSPQVEPTPKA